MPYLFRLHGKWNWVKAELGCADLKADWGK
jgi:hypothetical protein